MTTLELRQLKAPAVAVLSTLILTSGPTIGLAQTSASTAQDELNQRGVEAIIDGKYDAAIRLFKSSLDLGPLNITYLNLGRAYQKANQCNEALDAYNVVQSSPAVESPSSDEIAAALEKYRAELASTCPGFVRMECSANMMVSIDSAEPVPCSAEKVELPPGDHRFEGSVGDRHVKAGVTVVGMKTSNVVLDVGPAPSSPLNTWAMITSASGGALLLAGLGVDLFVLGPLVDDIDAATDQDEHNRLSDDLSSNQSLGLGLYIGGGVLAAAGIALFVLAPGDSGDAPEAQLPFNLWVSPDSIGVNAGTSW